jgi:hypothetical protein
MDHPRSGLRYVAADELDVKARDFANMPVIGTDDERLGSVEGFIIDTFTSRPRHVVVSAGWFIHKHFLVPVGHVSLGPDGTFVADTTKAHVSNFPGFDPDEFEKLPPDQIDRMDTGVTSFFTGEHTTGAAGQDAHFSTPDWWDPMYYNTPAGTRR